MGVFSLDFMRAHRRRFIEMISARHPLSREAIDRYASVLSWPHLSTNEQLPWGWSLIEAHAPRWAWLDLRICLSRLASRASSVELLRPLAEFGPSYYGLASDLEEAVGDRARLQARVGAGEKVCLARVVEWPDDAIVWIPALIERAPETARSELWHDLSQNSRFPWTLAFIEEHADALSWRALSCNVGLPWSPELVRRHEPRWDWTDLHWPYWSGEDERLDAFFDLVGDRIDWSAVVDHVVWTAERFDRARERLEACVAGADASRYWTFAAAPRRWTPAFVERLVALQAEIGRPTIDWSLLARRGGERLWTHAFYERYRDRLDHERLVENLAVAGLLDPEVVEAFLRACAQPLTGLPRNSGHEAVIAAAPGDLAGYDAYADWLEGQRDAQAVLIRTMGGVERGTVTPSEADSAAAAYASALGIEHGGLRWRNGFVRKLAWFRKHDTGDWRLALRLRPFAFVEELLIVDGVHRGFGHFDRARIRDEDWEMLASLPCLTKLALHQVSIEPTSKLRELVRITDLDLHGTCVFDLSIFAGMPALRSLVLHEDLWAIFWSGVDDQRREALQAVIDLGPLAEIPNLRHLGLRSSDAGCDLRPLRGCRNLETLELGAGYLYDVSVLDQLPALRRLWVGAASDTELEPLRARYPGLEINSGPRPWSTWQPGVEAWARVPEGYFDEDD